MADPRPAPGAPSEPSSAAPARGAGPTLPGTGSVPQGPPAWRRLVFAFASLRLTVPLFALAIVLTFAGTLAQADAGIWTAMDQYFRTFVARIDLKIFFPRSMDVPGSIPFPGGWLIGGLLLLNLIAAHSVRFKVTARGGRRAAGAVVLAAGAVLTTLLCLDRLGVQPGGLSSLSRGWAILTGVSLLLMAGCSLLFARRGGIVLAHSGLAVLLVSELITGLFAREGRMIIPEGGLSAWTEHSREPELVFIDRAHEDHDLEVAIPAGWLDDGRVVTDANLPFEVVIENVMPNARLRFIAGDEAGVNPATAGTGLELVADEQPEVSGTDMERDDEPAAYVTLREPGGGPEIATILVSYLFYPNFGARDLPQQVAAGERRFDVYLRPGRIYQPYTLHLLDFRHDLYPGTKVPKDFSSFVRLVDPEHGVDRDVRIWMNHPLRYRGKTFYQASFLPGDAGTILQVVDNPGWAIPYVSCLMVAFGLIAHFLGTLQRFLRREVRA